MSWVDPLRRFLRGASAAPGAESGEAVRLRAEVVRHYAHGRYAAAAESARRLLDWQKQTLGEQHPDYARGQANLALLLRKADEAEALSAQAVETPAVLEALHELDRDAGPEPRSEAAAVAPRLEVLISAFELLSDRLADSARALQRDGTPPPDDLIAAMAFCRGEFEALCREATGGRERPSNLEELASRLRPTARHVDGPPASSPAQVQAQARLARVLGLVQVGRGDAAPLTACQDEARRAFAAIARGDASLAAAVLDDRHPFAALLTLVEPPERLGDALWADLHERVGATFGRPLALAVSRGQVRAGGPLGVAIEALIE